MTSYKLSNMHGNWEDRSGDVEFCRAEFAAFFGLPLDGASEVMLHVTVLPTNMEWTHKVKMVPHPMKGYKQAEITDRDGLLVATKTFYSWTDEVIMTHSVGRGIVYVWIEEVAHADQTN